MTDTQDPAIYRADAYCARLDSIVTGHTDTGGLLLERTIFYPQGGGQPGDSGTIHWDGTDLSIATTRKAEDGMASVLVPAAPGPLPPVGATVTQVLDWPRRFRHMRVHTALHLLSVVIPLPVTGGQITAEKGRLDFDMPEAPADKDALQAELQALVDRDLPVSADWITEDALDAQPELVKTMSVQPPRGAGRIRLIRIGAGADQVDLQPCGGTHVARTGEIGRVRLGKIEKKGRQNRRVSVHLDDD